MPTVMSSPATPADATPPGRSHVAHYGKSRNFALYEGKNLLAVTLYKKGAETVQHALEARDTVIAEQATRIEQLMAAATPPGPEHAASAPTRFRDQVWPEVNGQLGFFSTDSSREFSRENENCVKLVG
jgi:hypothetical protein